VIFFLFNVLTWDIFTLCMLVGSTYQLMTSHWGCLNHGTYSAVWFWCRQLWCFGSDDDIQKVAKWMNYQRDMREDSNWVQLI